MALSDCEKCWGTPCTCGYGYETWSDEAIDELIKVLQEVKRRPGRAPSFAPDAIPVRKELQK